MDVEAAEIGDTAAHAQVFRARSPSNNPHCGDGVQEIDDTAKNVACTFIRSTSGATTLGGADAADETLAPPSMILNPTPLTKTARNSKKKTKKGVSLTRFLSQQFLPAESDYRSNHLRELPADKRIPVLNRANTVRNDGRTSGRNIHQNGGGIMPDLEINAPTLPSDLTSNYHGAGVAFSNAPNNKSTPAKRQFSRMRTRRIIQLNRNDSSGSQMTRNGFGSPSPTATAGKAMPAGRYFDALKGPELETLKDREESILPLDQTWPFLLRFPIGSFGICLGLGSQTILWKTMATSAISLGFLRIPLTVNLVIWCVAVASLTTISVVYAMKCVFYFEAVRREYYHPVRVNFFFAPWIASMFLTLGVPPSIATTIHPAVWCLLTAPMLALELKIYGQWLSGGERRLSKVANPSIHLSLVGNFISSLLASVVGWKEAAIFFWAVGAAHYMVAFVTLYQRLPTCDVLTRELHPVYFLFIAAPSAASVAWKSINDGRFDHFSRLPYFLALFLYSSLVVRLNFFCGFKFSLTWWAYTFPMTASAIATIHYSLEVRHPLTQTLAVLLSFISSLVVLGLLVKTLSHAAAGRLFPNDLAIAIATRTKRRKRRLRGLFKVDSEGALSTDSRRIPRRGDYSN